MNLHSIIKAATPNWRINHDLPYQVAIGQQEAGSFDREADALHAATFDPTLTAAMLAVCEAAAAVRRGAGYDWDEVTSRTSGVAELDSALCALESLLTERGLTMGGDDG